jgi:TPP-dependent 2-oxoacid decarboxylase
MQIAGSYSKSVLVVHIAGMSSKIPHKAAKRVSITVLVMVISKAFTDIYKAVAVA